MDICTKHSNEIAYSGRECPACETEEEIRGEYEDIIDELKTTITNLETKVRVYEGS